MSIQLYETNNNIPIKTSSLSSHEYFKEFINTLSLDELNKERNLVNKYESYFYKYDHSTYLECFDYTSYRVLLPRFFTSF
jgi:hypothetical protein